jgi:hypothetical protein
MGACASTNEAFSSDSSSTSVELSGKEFTDRKESNDVKFPLNEVAIVAVNNHFKRRFLVEYTPEIIVGDLNELVAEVQNIFFAKPESHLAKESSPFICIVNPPRHGKSLMLDRLFIDRDGYIWEGTRTNLFFTDGKTIFTLNDGFTDEVINVEIEKVRIVNNNDNSSIKGISNFGEELTVKDVIISGGYNGIENSGILNISNSTIRDNRGNGINSSGTLVINRNTITDNGNHGIY